MSPQVEAAIAKDKPNWEPRGNKIHSCLEAFLTGEALLDPGPYAEWVDPLLAHPLFERFEPVAVEHRMVSPDGFFAGSLDALLRGFDKDGKPITLLMDLKTLKHAHSPVRSIAAQAGAYITLLNDNHRVYVDKVIGLFSKPGSVELKIEDPQDCIDTWQHCLGEFKKTLPDW